MVKILNKVIVLIGVVLLLSVSEQNLVVIVKRIRIFLFSVILIVMLSHLKIFGSFKGSIKTRIRIIFVWKMNGTRNFFSVPQEDSCF